MPAFVSNAFSNVATMTCCTTRGKASSYGKWLGLQSDPKSLKVALLGGTGRMGIPLCATWANAGYDVIMCSRSKDKAQAIVDQLLTGNGYETKVSGGATKVPPCDTSHWRLVAGDNLDAAAADVIVLGTIFEETWPVLEKLAPLIRGKGKMIIDMTNPWLIRGDGYGKGIAPPLPQAAVLYHKQKLDDSTVRWAAAYKHVIWFFIGLEGPPPGKKKGVEVFGDDEAVEFVCGMIQSHGFVPVKRGGLDVAEDYETGTTPEGQAAIMKGGRGATRVKTGKPFPAVEDGLSDLSMM